MVAADFFVFLGKIGFSKKNQLFLRKKSWFFKGLSLKHQLFPTEKLVFQEKSNALQKSTFSWEKVGFLKLRPLKHQLFPKENLVFLGKTNFFLGKPKNNFFSSHHSSPSIIICCLCCFLVLVLSVLSVFPFCFSFHLIRELSQKPLFI